MYLPHHTVVTFWLKPFLDSYRLLCCSIVNQFDLGYPNKTQISSRLFDEIKVNVVPVFKLRHCYQFSENEFQMVRALFMRRILQDKVFLGTHSRTN